MFKKLAKILLGTMVSLIIFTMIYVAYYYFEGYMIAKSCLNSISYYVMSENCLASDKVYMENGTLTSVQDKVTTILKDYSDSNWYLNFETDSYVFGTGSDYTVSCYYTDEAGVQKDALTYDNAAPKGTVLTVELRCQFDFPLRLVPRREDQDVFTLELPVTVRTNIAGTKYYKGTEDTFK